MNAAEAVAEALRQMIEGDDYTPLDRLIEDLTPEQAARKPDGSPYSIATVTWHAWFWANAWIVRIQGAGDPFGGLDPYATWPVVAPEDWPSVRDRALASLDAAAALAQTEQPDRETRPGWTAGQNLLQIAIHTAYHIGQITLIRQELGLWPPAGCE